jgi:hypothetical protein
MIVMHLVVTYLDVMINYITHNVQWYVKSEKKQNKKIIV